MDSLNLRKNTCNNIKKIVASLKKTSLVKKLILGYFLIILIPTVILAALLYNQFYDNMLNEYLRYRQQFLEQAIVNLKVDLTRTEAIYNLFQYNTNVVEYLNGFYDSDAESVYTFIKYIRPLVEYVMIGVPSTEDIKIYKNNNRILSLGSVIVSNDALENAGIIRNTLLPGKGMWDYAITDAGSIPKLKYYQKIYDNSFTKEVGVMEVTVREGVLQSFMENLKSLSVGNGCIVFLDSDNDLVYETGLKEMGFTQQYLKEVMGNWEKDVSQRFYHNGKCFLINTLAIKALNINTVLIEDESVAFAKINIKPNMVIIYAVMLLFILSLIYYFIASNITMRVRKLAKHMMNVDEKNLSLYKGKIGKDEIGFLIHSYNSLIQRINELVNNVHRAELLRKEAAYAALQAQIRPHFLYGTLESIRMLAESNGDCRVSDIIFTFGKLLRYSMSSKRNEVSLTDEIENVRDYLEIQKIRMADRLHYNIDVDAEIDSDEFLCPQFILQPLVENSIVHGISNCLRQGHISIRVYESIWHIIIAIRDNGVGIPEEKLKTINDMLDHKIDIKDFQTEKSGFGVYSVNERVRAFFGGDSRLVIESRPREGTNCMLYLNKSRGVQMS